MTLGKQSIFGRLNMKILTAVAASILMAGSAHAATLTNDTVNVLVTSTDTTSPYFDGSVLVDAGAEGTLFGNQTFDLNAGPDGDLITISSSSTFTSYDGSGGTISWTFSDLDLDTGSILDGVSLTQPYSNASISDITASSFTVSWIDTDLPQGIYISIQLGNGSTPVVPLPAGAPLLIGGLALLGFVRRRKP